MSATSEITTVEFERREAFLSSDDDDESYTIHGVAIGEGDVTKGSSGIKKYWPADELQDAAETLEGTNLVVDHDNSSSGVVGRVVKAGYEEGSGVLYEAELYDEDLADKIENGLLEVSIRGLHKDVEEMDENDDGALVVEDIEFANLSIVPSGASPSNTLEMGASTQLSAAELAEATASFGETELAEVEPSDFVQWGDDMHGVVLSMPEDGEVEVDVYEQDDDTWRPTGETEMVSVDSLSEWDVSEDDIGAMSDDSDGEENTADPDEPSSTVPADEGSSEESDDGSQTSDEELQDYEMHEVSWDGTKDDDWSSPDLEDFTDESWGDLSEDERNSIDSHFIISASGFPADSYGDLKLPVVEPGGELNLNALAAVKGGRGVSAVDGLASDMEDEIVTYVNGLANEHFDAGWDEEEAEAHGKRQRTIDDTGDEPNVVDGGPVGISQDFVQKYLAEEGNNERDTVDDMMAWMFNDSTIPTESIDDFRSAANAFMSESDSTDSYSSMTVEQYQEWLQVNDGMMDDEEDDTSGTDDVGSPSKQVVSVKVLTGDDLWQRSKSGESEADSISQLKVINMTEEETEEDFPVDLEDLEDPVAVEQTEIEDLRQKAEKYDDISDDISELRERTEVLDDVSRDQVDELADSDDPVVVESARYDELQNEAEQVKKVYAANLAEEVEIFDEEELTDRFDIEELREKHTEHVGELEEELSQPDPDPKSEDPSEEELEEAASEDGDKDEEELSDEVEARQEELREKILS